MRAALIVVAGLSLACGATLREQMISDVAGQASCSPRQVSVSELMPVPTANQAAHPRVAATVSGCDREYVCVEVHGNRVSCEETKESERRALISIITDRLSVETACPVEKVRVTQQAKWRQGKNLVARLEACGQAYVCETRPGMTECKFPLVGNEGEQAVTRRE